MVGRALPLRTMDGFYKHGVWQPRPRTQEEKRWAAGGQGKVRQDKRSSRMRAWTNGEWIPSWLRKFREEKEERDRLRRQQAATHQRLDEEQDDEAQEKEGDETELWQQRSAHGGGDELWDDVVSFMERPGMSGQEYVDLINGGIRRTLHAVSNNFYAATRAILALTEGQRPVGHLEDGW